MSFVLFGWNYLMQSGRRESLDGDQAKNATGCWATESRIVTGTWKHRAWSAVLVACRIGGRGAIGRSKETGGGKRTGLHQMPKGPYHVHSLTSSALLRYKVYEPVLVVGSEKFANIDIRLRVKGGGHVSQLYALRQAIAKGIVA